MAEHGQGSEDHQALENPHESPQTPEESQRSHEAVSDLELFEDCNSFIDNSSPHTPLHESNEEFSNEMPIEDIFTDLVSSSKTSPIMYQHPSFSYKSSDIYTTKHAEEIYTERGIHGNTSIDDQAASKGRTLTGKIPNVIQGKKMSLPSFKFSNSHTEESINRDSPRTVSQQRNNLNTILPFPASFPSVRTPIEALILTNSSTLSFSMSQAVPDSPTPVSPLSFDAGSPCVHLLPGNINSYLYPPQRSKSGPLRNQNVPKSTWSLSKSMSFSGAHSGDIFGSSISNQPMLAPNQKPIFSKMENSSSRGSSKSTTTNASSEFSIELSGRLSGANLNSSRYLDLDLRKEAIKQELERIHTEHARVSYTGVYDIKADKRTRVEEVVRNTDESKFTFSPVASSFLFAKSGSHDANTRLFSGNLEGYIDFQPEDFASPPGKRLSAEERISRSASSSKHHEAAQKTKTCWLFWISCCRQGAES